MAVKKKVGKLYKCAKKSSQKAKAARNVNIIYLRALKTNYKIAVGKLLKHKCLKL